MLAYFSIEGKKFHPRYVKTVNKMDPARIEGPLNVTQTLDGRVARFVKLELYFENKWLLLSEIRFSSKESDRKNLTDADMLEPRDKVVDQAPTVNNNKKVDNIEVAENSNPPLSDTPESVEEVLPGVSEQIPKGRKEGNSSSSSKQAANSEVNQIYVGLVIGVLSVTVLLLLVTILVMMRRNKQKIFNKHAMMFKTPLASNDRHLMRDLTPLNHTANTGTGKLYGESDHEESSSIYHEPYRLVLQRGNTYRNSSCGRLCDYEDLGLLGSEQKSKFGSTPLFTLPPAPPTTSTNSSAGSNQTSRTGGRFMGPTSYSCHEVKNGYAIPTHSTTLNSMAGRPLPPTKAMTPNENFYAATDIVLKVSQKSSTFFKYKLSTICFNLSFIFPHINCLVNFSCSSF